MSVRDLWRGARSGPGKRWEVLWREGGKQRAKRFASRPAAERFEAERRLDPETRMAAEGRRLTVHELMKRWLDSKAGLKRKTLDAYRVDAREVTAALGEKLATEVTPSDVRAWTARDRGVSMRRRSLTALGQAYRLAIGDGLLKSSPCVGVRAPRAVESERRALSWEELSALAAAAGEDAAMVWLLGTTGLRLGELIGLQVGDVSASKGRIRVSRSVVWTSTGRTLGPPKNGRWREVGVPEFVLAMLPLAGRKRDAWLFVGAQGGQLDGPGWRRGRFARAAESAGLAGLHPHELRHTAATLAINGGATVMDVQQMLGHASPDITLRVYAHAWDSGVDRVARMMERQASENSAAGRRKPAEPSSGDPV